MAYSTGTATGADDLLTKWKDFAVAQGWTLNSFATLGAGHRLHIQKGSSLFFNFRTYINESTSDVSATNGATIYAILGNASTGYNAGSAWNQQPGAPVWNSFGTQTLAGGVTGLNSSSITYHFFAFSSPADALYMIVEQPSGIYQFIGCGQLVKFGTWTGGAFYCSAVAQDQGAAQNCACLIGEEIGGYRPFSMVRVEGVDSFTGYATGRNYGSGYPAPRAIDSIYLFRESHDDAPNSFNSLAPLEPVVVLMTRSGAIQSDFDETSQPFSDLGYLPHLHAVNMQGLAAAGNYPLSGSGDTYKCFPITAINAGAMGQFNNPPHSRYFGIAIKSN
jgi:hypothetical protein